MWNDVDDKKLLILFSELLDNVERWVDNLDFNSITLQNVKGYDEWWEYFEKTKIVWYFAIFKKEHKLNLPDADLDKSYGENFLEPLTFLFGSEYLLIEHKRLRFQGLIMKTRALSIQHRFLRKYLIVKKELKDKFDFIMKFIEGGITVCELIITTALYKEISFKNIIMSKTTHTGIDKYQSDTIILGVSVNNIKDYIKNVEWIDKDSYKDLFQMEVKYNHQVQLDINWDRFCRLLDDLNKQWKTSKEFLSL